MSWISKALAVTALGPTLACIAAAPGLAAPAATPNVCQYSYDGYWRDMPITYDGGATPTTAARGAAITLAGQTLNPTLPDWLAQYGYNFGLLRAGENEIPTTVWMATRGAGTSERTRVQQFDTTATTTVHVGPGGIFASADPFVYATPALPTTSWTAKGGRVEFRQAGSGSLPQLPVGPGGALVKPKGSVYILAQLGDAQLGLDCMPGTYQSDGVSYAESVAAPFASVDVPALSCLSALPAVTNVAPVAVDLASARVPSTRGGESYAFAPAVDFALPEMYLRALHDEGVLADGDNTVTIQATAAIAARNGSPAVQALAGSAAGPITVRVEDDGDTITVVDPAGGNGALDGRIVLATGTWTPSGVGTLELAAGLPGSLPALSVAGRDEPVRPYGSVYVRLTATPAAGAPAYWSLDCVSAGASVVGGTPPVYDEGGNQAAPAGDAGRYAFDAYELDPFAEAYLLPPLPTTPTPLPPPAPSAPPDTGPPPSTDPPRVDPSHPSIVAGSLSTKRGRVTVRVRCSGLTTCRGTLRLRSAAKLRSSARARKRIVTLTTSRAVAVPPVRPAGSNCS